MAIPTPKVEIGLDATEATFGSFFTLGDSTKGVLGNSAYVLAGTIFYDVTDRVRSFSVNRGKNQEMPTITAGEAVIEFNNFDRAFDPLYPASPFFGNIIPRREVKISSNGEILFRGWIEDWNLSYSKDGESIVDAVAIDAFSILAVQTLNGFTPTEQTSGARVNTILSRPEVNWAETQREIDEGRATLGTQAVEDGTNVLQYLQSVTISEPGNLFIGKNGAVTFRQRSNPINTSEFVEFKQDGTGIPYDNISVVYGSEQLYNRVTVSRLGGGTAIASDALSQSVYGIRDYTITDTLLSTDEQAAQLAVNFAYQYSEPEYRFDSFDVKMNKLDTTDQNKILNIEIGDPVYIEFTPNGIGDPIQRYLEVQKIEHVVTPQEHVVRLGFRALEYPAFTLGDASFGKLGLGVLAW